MHTVSPYFQNKYNFGYIFVFCKTKITSRFTLLTVVCVSICHDKYLHEKYTYVNTRVNLHKDKVKLRAFNFTRRKLHLYLYKIQNNIVDLIKNIMACSSKFTHPTTYHIIHYIKPIYFFSS